MKLKKKKDWSLLNITYFFLKTKLGSSITPNLLIPRQGYGYASFQVLIGPIGLG
jgi:hypothetical protein